MDDSEEVEEEDEDDELVEMTETGVIELYWFKLELLFDDEVFIEAGDIALRRRRSIELPRVVAAGGVLPIKL